MPGSCPAPSTFWSRARTICAQTRPRILTLIRPGIPRAATHDDPWTSAVYGGVEQTIADLFRTSKIVPEMAKTGEVGVIGAVYEIETGKVKFSQMFTQGGPENSTESAHPLDWKPAPTVTSARAH